MSKYELLRQFARDYRKPVTIGVIALAIVNPIEIALPLLLLKAIDGIGSGHSVLGLAVAYFLLTCIQGVARVVWRIYLPLAGLDIGRKIRQQLVRALLCQSYPLASRYSTGELVTRLSNDTDAVARAFDFGVVIVVDAAIFFATIPWILLYLAPDLALVAFLPLIVIPFLVRRKERTIRKRYRVVQEAQDRLTAFAERALKGVASLKSIRAERGFDRRFGTMAAEQVEIARGLAWTETSFGPLLEIWLVVSTILVLFYGGVGVLSGTLTLGTLVAFTRYIQLLNWPMHGVAMAVALYKKSLTSSERIAELTSSSEATQPLTEHSLDRGGVTINRLSVTNGAPILSEIEFRTDPREFVAVVGPVGSGKTTLLAAIAGLVPFQGRVVVDGFTVHPGEPHSRTAYLPNAPFVFSSTIRENLLLAKSGDSEISDEVLWTILGQVQLEAEVRAMPRGLTTLVGEGGTLLSGGQRQRLALGRAILADRPLMLLDAVSTALDLVTEQRVIQMLRTQRRTILFSTNRPSSIRYADRVLCLSRGKVAFFGRAVDAPAGSWLERFLQEHSNGGVQ